MVGQSDFLVFNQLHGDVTDQLSFVVVDKAKKLLPGFGVFPEDPQHCACYCLAVQLLYPSHHHTHVTVEKRNHII